MNRQLLASSGVALLLMAATGAVLLQVRTHQSLAAPGVKTHPVPGSVRLHADLPEHVLDYQSKEMETEPLTLAFLPSDTSFGWRRYQGPNGLVVDLRVVLMGRDRTSLHKPQFCLTGQGWHINDVASAETSIRINSPRPYDLPVIKLIANTTAMIDGQSRSISGVYVYWYVAADGLSGTTSGAQRMWWMATKLLRTGVLQRWAYVSCFATCLPGQETATFERIKQFIPAAVPQFQLYPGTPILSAAR